MASRSFRSAGSPNPPRPTRPTGAPGTTVSAFNKLAAITEYHWWGLNNPNGTYDYLAWGKDGQYIYVSPSTNTVVVRLGGGQQYDQFPFAWPLAIRALISSIK